MKSVQTVLLWLLLALLPWQNVSAAALAGRCAPSAQAAAVADAHSACPRHHSARAPGAPQAQAHPALNCDQLCAMLAASAAAPATTDRCHWRARNEHPAAAPSPARIVRAPDDLLRPPTA